MKNDSNLRDEWTRASGRVARRINLAWWLQMLATPLVVTGLVGAVAFLLVRRHFPDLASWQLGLFALGAFLVIGLICWLAARRRFETADGAMVRLEASMRLRNQLSAAKAGVARWPEIPAKIDAGLNWNWQRVVVPGVASLLLLIAGIAIPVSAVTEADRRTPDEPLAWKQIEADLERLQQDEVLDEEYLEEVRRKVDELRANEEEEWFSHSSLEATDSLKQQHRSEVERLERELGRADRALGSLQRHAGAMPKDRRDQLLNQFDQALQGLQNGALKPNPQLLEQLRQLDPQNLGQLDPEQLQQLRENLQKAGQACKECQGGGGQGDEWLDELLDGQDGQDPGGEKEGEGFGKGGVDRGPGHAPGVLGKEGDPLGIGDLEGLEAKDLSRSLPGDLLQLQDGEHEVDLSPSEVRAGGAAGATGAGGDRVWKEALDPDEQRTLKRFFE